MAERITGHTELIGLMAYPIRHSSSPAMHNEAFAYLGLDYAYLAFEVDNSTLEDAVKRIKKLEKENADFMELEKLTLGSLRKAVQDGDTVNGTLMAGQIAGLIRREQTCREIIEETVQQAQECIAAQGQHK